MTLPVGPDFRTAVGYRARFPFVWRARELSLTPKTGQTPTNSITTAATVTDSFSATMSTIRDVPPWSYVAGQTCVGLLLGGSSRYVQWLSFSLIPQAMNILVEFVENGGLGVASGIVLYLGNAGVSGARVWIDSTGTQYRVSYTDGTTTRTCTMTGTAPTNGQKVQLRVILSSTGTVQLGQSINGGAETLPSASAATTLPAAWSGTVLSLNAGGGGANTSNNIYTGIVVMLGNQTQAVLQRPLL